MERIVELEKQIYELQNQLKDAIQEVKNEIDQKSEKLQSEQLAWQTLTSKLDSTLLPNKIKLDIGGTYFTTSKHTLMKHKQTYFSTLCSRNADDQLQAANEISYFIDRNPAMFSYILDYMRGETININNLTDSQLEQLRNDAAYYQFPELHEITTRHLQQRNPKLLIISNNNNNNNNNSNSSSITYNNNTKVKDEVDMRFVEGPNYTLTANKKVATKTSNSAWDVVIKGSIQIIKHQHPLQLPVVRWNIHLLKSGNSSIMIGVAPITIDQTVLQQYLKSGYYLYCNGSTLYSGAPFSYSGNAEVGEYGKRRRINQGQVVGVQLNTENASVEFFVDGVSLGVAYENVPMVTPLCPCVLLYHSNDSVEILP